MLRLTHSRLALSLALVGIALTASEYRYAASASSPKPVRWKKTVIDPKFRSEGVSVADVNRDGKKDVLVGNLWYAGPNWTPHEIRPPLEIDPATGYSNCFHSFAEDVDRDGWTDQIVIGPPGGKASWFRNPGKTKGEWTETTISDNAGNESPNFTDADRDRKPEPIFAVDETYMALWKRTSDPKPGFRRQVISEPKAPGCERYSHGLGVGDINGDRRADVLCTKGFWTAPADRTSGPWPFTPADLGPDCAHMYTHDFDGDGDMDVISSSAHAVGVWWHEQVKGEKGPEFRRHTIDDTFSQSHSMVMADLNGDMKPDFITGKRKWAHGPTGDVNPNDPAVLVWYEFRREGGKVIWTRHEIDNASGVGTQFTVTDVNRDRRPDIVISNKNGVFLFEQARG